MSSPGEDVADTGLLSPVSAGTAGERLTGDRAVVAAMLRAEVALLRTLVATGIAPSAAGAAADRLSALSVDPRDLALQAPAGGNPVIPLVQRLRAGLDPELARWVHFGATSQDIVDTALMLVARDAARQIESDLAAVAGTLARLADRSRGVPMVARTLTQQAWPTTLGMRVSGWLAGVHDAVLAIRGCTRLQVSLGGPVGTLSAYGDKGPAVLDGFAAALDQSAPVSSWHTRRTPLTATAAALVGTGAGCGKIAADLLLMSQNEVGEAREASGGGSSSMAHKHNPAQSVLIAAAARQLPALACVIATSGIAEQERPAGAWHAEWQTLRTMLRLSAGAAERTAALVSGIRFDETAMRRNLDQLVHALTRDEAWVATETAHVGLWIDRVLTQNAGVFG